MVWKPDYVILADAKVYLRIADTVDDAELAVAITAVSRLIDTACNRQFGQLAAPAVRTYDRAPLLNQDSGLWELEIDDVQDTTAMTVNGVAVATAGVLLPRNAAADGVPYTRVGFTTWPIAAYPGQPSPNVASARWGWTAVPAAVPMAARLQLNRLGFRRDAPQGVAGSPDQGSELRMLAKLDPDVVKLLGTVRRRRRAA